MTETWEIYFNWTIWKRGFQFLDLYPLLWTTCRAWAIKYTKRNYDKYFQKLNQTYFAGAPYSHLPPSPSYSRTRHKTHYYPRYWSLLDYGCDHVELVEVLGDYFNVQQVINSSQVSSWKDQAFVIFCPPTLFLLNIWFNWLIWKIVSDHRKIF